MAKEHEDELGIAEILASLQASRSGAKASKEQPFVNFTMYSAKDVYLGNFSLPENFSEVTKASVLKFFENKGIKMLTPGATRKDIALDDLE